MTKLRTGRQKYYDIFAHFYDLFIKVHSGRHRDETRMFLVDSVHLNNVPQTRILDICCGTGSVILAFAEKYSRAATVGYDFSAGMLHKAQQKDTAGRLLLVQGDAARLSYRDNSF